MAMNRTLRKFINLLVYLGVPLVGIYVLLISKGGDSSDQSGTMIWVYNKFLRDADTWNVFIMLACITFSLLLFIVCDLFVTWTARKIANKWKPLSFLAGDLFSVTGKFFLSVGLLGFILLASANGYIYFLGIKNTVTSASLHNVRDSIPVLVLGTSKHLKGGPGKGKENRYFTYRIEAAKELWEKGKASQFIVSGDKTGDYDETRDMKSDLIAFGVPENRVKVDTSGLRTLDSMLRLRNLFKIKECFIVSQDFHVWRSIFQAKFYNMKPHGFYAKGTSTMGMVIREMQARPKAVLDLLFFNMMPRDKMEESLTKHRKEFAVTSDKHLYMIFALVIAIVSTLFVVFQYTNK